MNRFHIVAMAKLKRKKQAEQDEKNSKKQRVPWRWDAQSTSMKAITATPVSEMTFKQFLEAQYATSEEQYNCPVCRTTFTKRESKGKGISVKCPKCKHHFTKQGTSLGWLRSDLSDEEINKLPVAVREARYYKQKKVYYHIDGGFEVELVSSRDAIITIRDTETDEEHVMGEEEFSSNYQLKEARYYKQKEDWQEDTNEHGEGTAACPRCKGYALYTTQGNTPATARSFWECQECGHTGPKHKY